MSEAIERVRRVLEGISIEAFEMDWEKRWRVERGIEIISEASRHHLKIPQPGIPWEKVSGIGNIPRHENHRVAQDVLWKLALDDLPLLYQVCREELVTALAREREGD
jgi:uncharacterized protein with HEPN domain